VTRRALVIGIDYPGTPYALNGCVNDADAWGDVLAARRFVVERLTNEHATRAAILGTLRNFVTQARAGDALVFCYSGHGTNIRDTDGDEADGRDECLCPVDMETAGLIVDDHLFAILAQLPPRVGFTMIADSCYSGTVTRFADFSGRLGRLALPPRKARYVTAPKAAVEATLDARADGQFQPAARSAAARARREAGAWATISACRPDEVSYESEGEDGTVGGHFTMAAMRVLATAGSSLTHAGFLKRVSAEMGGADADQHPTYDGAPGTERRTLVSVPR
jgi:hypothetical protein